MKFITCLILLVLSVSIITSPLKVESFDLTQNEDYLRSLFSINGFKMTPDEQAGAVQVEIEGMLENSPFKITGSLGPFINAIDPKLKWPVDLNIEAAGASLSLRGTINNFNKFEGIDIDFVVRGNNLDGIGGIFGIKMPAVEDFLFKGNLKDSLPLRFEISDLYLIAGKSEVKGSASIDLTKERPQIVADLFSPYLDLQKLIAGNDVSSLDYNMEKTIEEHKIHSPQNGKLFSDEPFDLEFLKNLDLHLRLSGEKMLLPRLALRSFQLQSSIKNGGFTVDTLNGDIGSGRLGWSFTLTPSGNTYIVSTLLEIDQMNLTSMLEDMETDIHGEGMLESRLDLNARGDSISELMAGLDGNVSLIMGEGQVDRSYLRFLGLFRINLISSIVNILSIPVGMVKREETSRINCFVMRFDINGGIANLTAFVLDTPQNTIAASGQINLSNEKVDIYLKPISKEGIGAEGLAKFNLSLSELTKAFYLGGTLANPSVAIDSAQTFFTLGKAVGGVVLFGPAGVAAALLSGKIGGGSKNLCVEAIEVAQKGVEFDDEKRGIFRSLGDLLKRLNPFSR